MTHGESRNGVGGFSFRWGVALLDQGFVQVPDCFLDTYTAAGITGTEFLLILHLARYRWERAGSEAWPAIKTIARQMGLTSRTVRRLLSGLEDRGLLKRWLRAGKTTIYDVGGFSRTLLRLYAERVQAGEHEAQADGDWGVTLMSSLSILGGTPVSGVGGTPMSGESHALKQREDSPDEGPSGERGPPSPSIPSGIPDPSRLTVKQVAGLDLDKGEWCALGDAEAQGKDRAGVREVVERKLRAAPAAVEAYREIAEVYPKKVLWPTIAETVGDQQEELDLWGRVVLAWVANGWRPTNVRGMLEFYGRREIPPPTGRGRDDGRGGGRAATFVPKARVTGANTPTAAQMEADRRAFAAHRQRRAAEDADAVD